MGADQVGVVDVGVVDVCLVALDLRLELLDDVALLDQVVFDPDPGDLGERLGELRDSYSWVVIVSETTLISRAPGLRRSRP